MGRGVADMGLKSRFPRNRLSPFATAALIQPGSVGSNAPSREATPCGWPEGGRPDNVRWVTAKSLGRAESLGVSVTMGFLVSFVSRYSSSPDWKLLMMGSRLKNERSSSGADVASNPAL